MIYSAGHCVLTLGTPNQEEVRLGKVNLLPSHCYAVIGQSLIVIPQTFSLMLRFPRSSDISDDEEDRTLTILDSWESGPTSTGSREAHSLLPIHLPLTLV